MKRNRISRFSTFRFHMLANLSPCLFLLAHHSKMGNIIFARRNERRASYHFYTMFCYSHRRQETWLSYRFSPVSCDIAICKKKTSAKLSCLLGPASFGWGLHLHETQRKITYIFCWLQFLIL